MKIKFSDSEAKTIVKLLTKRIDYLKQEVGFSKGFLEKKVNEYSDVRYVVRDNPLFNYTKKHITRIKSCINDRLGDEADKPDEIELKTLGEILIKCKGSKILY